MEFRSKIHRKTPVIQSSTLLCWEKNGGQCGGARELEEKFLAIGTPDPTFISHWFFSIDPGML